MSKDNILLDALHFRGNSIKSMVDTYKQPFKQVAVVCPISDEELSAAVDEELNAAEYFDKVGTLLGDTFTQDEQNTIAAFYQSDVGAKLHEAMPVVFDRISEIRKDIGAKILSNLDTKFSTNEVLAKLSKEKLERIAPGIADELKAVIENAVKQLVPQQEDEEAN